VTYDDLLDQERRPHHADLGLIPKPGREAAGVNADELAAAAPSTENEPSSLSWWLQLLAMTGAPDMPGREEVSTSM